MTEWAIDYASIVSYCPWINQFNIWPLWRIWWWECFWSVVIAITFTLDWHLTVCTKERSNPLPIWNEICSIQSTYMLRHCINWLNLWHLLMHSRNILHQSCMRKRTYKRIWNFAQLPAWSKCIATVLTGALYTWNFYSVHATGQQQSL